LKFEFQTISAKPCSLARFFVLGEKNFAFFHFLKSYFKLFKLLGACLKACLKYMQTVELLLALKHKPKDCPSRVKQSVFQQEIEYSTDF